MAIVNFILFGKFQVFDLFVKALCVRSSNIYLLMRIPSPTIKHATCVECLQNGWISFFFPVFLTFVLFAGSLLVCSVCASGLRDHPIVGDSIRYLDGPWTLQGTGTRVWARVCLLMLVVFVISLHPRTWSCLHIVNQSINQSTHQMKCTLTRSHTFEQAVEALQRR